MGPRVDSTAPSTYDVGSESTDSQMTSVQTGETNLVQVAQRLNMDPGVLLAANPQIRDPNRLTPGTAIQIPQTTPGAAPAASAAADPAATTESASSKRSEAGLSAMVMRTMLSSAQGAPATSAPAGADAAAVAGQPAEAAVPPDPRLAEFYAALEAGNGRQAMEEANKLIATLQSEKPPQPQLLEQARMSLAAGAMLSGDLDAAQKALLSVDPKKLNDADKQQFSELRDLLADAHREAFSDAFSADADGGNVKDRGKAAAEQAQSLLGLLQKTDSGNTAAIDEAKLRLANAKLMGGHYREAEKALAGIHEKQLVPEHKQYLESIHQEIHAQQIDTLGARYAYDMKHQRYKEAVENATNAVNDLSKYFPESKVRIMAGRLQQATAQVGNSDLEGARKSLAKVTREEFQAAPKELQKLYRDLNGDIDKRIAAEKKLKSDQADIRQRLQTIEMLEDGDSTLKNDAVAMAQGLLEEIKGKYPDKTEAIENMELTVANAQLAAGYVDNAIEQLQNLANATSDPDMKDRAQLVIAQATLQKGEADVAKGEADRAKGHTDFGQGEINKGQNETAKAAQMLRSLSETASSPEVQKAAKDGLVHVEAQFVDIVQHKAELEQQQLDQLKKEKDLISDVTNREFGLDDAVPFGLGIALKSVPHLSDADHTAHMKELKDLQEGAGLAASVMENNGLTLAELRGMSTNALAKLPGVGGEQNARKIIQATANDDMRLIAEDHFQGGKFSWNKGTWYVDPSYLDLPHEKATKWIANKIGEGLRELHDEASKLAGKGIPGVSDAAKTITNIMDEISMAKQAIKDSINTAYDFYNRAQRDGAWYGGLGRAATFLADQASSLVTAPATVVDYRASDAERADAITDTATMVILAAGGPAVSEALGGVGRRVASSRLGQLVADSPLGKAANWTWKALNTEIKLGRLTPSKGVDEAVEQVLGGKTPDQIRASITPQDLKKVEDDLIKAKRREVTKEVTKAVESDVRSDLVRDGIPPDQIKGKTKEKIDQIVSRDFPEARLRKLVQDQVKPEEMQRIALADRVYNQIYHGEFPEKTANLKPELQTAYNDQLKASKGTPLANNENAWNMPDGKGLVTEDDFWHHRLSKVNGEIGLDSEAIKSGKDIRRFYFNLQPGKAAEFADYLSNELKAQNVKWQYKMPKELKSFDRPDAGVLYVEKADYQAVKKIVMDYAKKHPEAFAEGTPGFTKAISNGIAVAEEPLQQGLPKGPGDVPKRYSFGELRSEIISESILQAPPGITKDQLKQLVRQRMDWLGLNMDRPWLQHGRNVDDL